MGFSVIETGFEDWQVLHTQPGTGAPLRPLLSELGAHLPNPPSLDCLLLHWPGEDPQGADLPGWAAAGGPRCDRAELRLPAAPGALGDAEHSWREARIPDGPDTIEPPVPRPARGRMLAAHFPSTSVWTIENFFPPPSLKAFLGSVRGRSPCHLASFFLFPCKTGHHAQRSWLPEENVRIC